MAVVSDASMIDLEFIRQPRKKRAALAILIGIDPKPAALAKLVALIEHIDHVNPEPHVVAAPKSAVENVFVTEVHGIMLRLLLRIGKSCAQARAIEKIDVDPIVRP